MDLPTTDHIKELYQLRKVLEKFDTLQLNWEKDDCSGYWMPEIGRYRIKAVTGNNIQITMWVWGKTEAQIHLRELRKDDNYVPDMISGVFNDYDCRGCREELETYILDVVRILQDKKAQKRLLKRQSAAEKNKLARDKFWNS